MNTRASCISLFAGVLALSACNRRTHQLPNVPNQPVPPAPVDIELSIENSKYMEPYYDPVEKKFISFLSALSTNSVPYQLALFRSTENQDGNYDSRAQGPTPIIASTDKDVPGELHANLQAIRSSFQGSAPLPIDSLVRAAADARVNLDPKRHKLLLTINSNDSGKYTQGALMDSQGYWQHYKQEFDDFYGSGNWHFIPIEGPPEPAASGDSFLTGFVWFCEARFADSVAGSAGALTIGNDYSPLVLALVGWH